MDYLVNLNLNKNELQNAVIQPLAAEPSTGKLGQIYYNSADKLMYQHNGTAWIAVGKGKVTDVRTYGGTSVVDSSTGIAKLPTFVFSLPKGEDSGATYHVIEEGNLYFVNSDGEISLFATKIPTQGLQQYNITGTINSVALSKVTGADDLKAIEALTGTSGLLKKTAANTWTLDTTAYLSSQWTARLITGSANNDTSTKAGGSNSVYLNLVENNTVRDAHQIVGSGTVTVASDASGKITISGSAHPTAGTTATAVSTTASGGSATTWSKSDHVHSISLATGDSNGQVKIAGSNVSVKGLDAAAYKAVVTTVDTSGSLPTSGAVKTYVDNAIAGMPEPMLFKGSVGTGGTVTWANLPTAATSNEGWTYKVITAHTAETGKPAAKVGDTIISTGSEWVVIPSGDEPSGTVTSVGITNGGLISVSGSPITTSGSITLTHGTPTGAGTKTSGFYKFSTDAYGHVNGTTAVAKSDITGLLGNYVTSVNGSSGAVTISNATQSAAGLMSATDKQTLDTLSAASQGALVSGTLTIAKDATSVSASAIASKLISWQAYQGGAAVMVDYDGSAFSIAEAATSAITIKYIKIV